MHMHMHMLTPCPPLCALLLAPCTQALRDGKPFNPLLGETYEWQSPDRTKRCAALRGSVHMRCAVRCALCAVRCAGATPPGQALGTREVAGLGPSG